MDVDWAGGLYYGTKIDWKYDQTRNIDLSMPKYVPSAPHELQHPKRRRPQHAPHRWGRPNNTTGQGIKYTIDPIRTEMKKNPKSRRNISLLWQGSQPNANSGIWIHTSS